MPASVSVVVAKFEDLVALGLGQLIAEDPNLDLLEDGVHPLDVEASIERHSPAVAVLNFGSLTSSAQVFELHGAFPETRLVVLANRPTAAECNQMLSFGATACVSKETQGRDVVHAIYLASRGMHVLPRSAAAGGQGNGLALDGGDLLTPREADVLELLQDGATNAQIAQSLSIGLETVRTHARHIYRKLGISSRRDLARLSRPDPGGPPEETLLAPAPVEPGSQG
ncbi:MAG: response regulator transcription factor [Actinomycetota bacterium]|nr:response regulator transcription factor [Actinomycetota bacterium]